MNGTAIPANWVRKKIKYLVSLKSGEAITSDLISDSGDYPVYGGNGLRGFTSRFTHRGDYVLIGRQGALCGNINYASGEFWASEHAIVVDTGGKSNVRWLGELLRSMDLNQYSQSAAQPGLSVEAVANLKVPVPPPDVQLVIGQFLSRELGRLDTLICAKERLLSVIAERRRALIAHTVTRGVNPNASMRESGLPWLGQIPAHWDVERLKFHLFGIEQGWSPQCDNYPAGEGEWGVLKVGCVNGREFDESENKRLPDGVEPLINYEVQPGDLLMSRANTTELLGSTALVTSVRPRLLICDKLYRLKVNEARLDKGFLVTFLRSTVGRFEFERDATGASNSMQNIGQDSVRNVWLPVPPIPEQRSIVAYIVSNTTRLDALSADTERTIGLLKERRAAIIAAAVTGRVEIAQES